MNVRRVIIAAAVVGGASMASIQPVDAALLATDTAALASFRGTQAFTKTISGLTINAAVEYAVYAPGAFSTSTALGSPTDPSGGTQYVYAYQITNTGSPTQRTIGELSVGLDGDTQSANIGVIGGGGFGINPTTSAFVPASAPFASAHWIYTPELTSAQVGNVLLFTSPKAPHFFNATILGGALSDQQSLPSPIPEPASIMVLSGLGMLALGLRRKNRATV